MMLGTCNQWQKSWDAYCKHRMEVGNQRFSSLSFSLLVDATSPLKFLREEETKTFGTRVGFSGFENMLPDQLFRVRVSEKP